MSKLKDIVTNPKDVLIYIEDMIGWFALMGIVVAAMILFFFIGADRELDRQQEVTRTDRLRIYCNMPQHLEAICKK
jgi:hypothetical protein